MGKTTENKAWEKLNTVLTSSFKPDPLTEIQLTNAARRIGGICRSFRDRAIPDHTAHVSVTSSGEYSYPVSKGAQAAAVRDALERILTKVPDQDWVENTPFGPAIHVKGLELWRTLYRPEDKRSLTGSFGEEFDSLGAIRSYGLDEYVGKQMMYVAWKDNSPVTIQTLRAQVVPEMGNKARYVTLSEYFLNVLQAPLAHIIIDAMKWHPSVFSSFHRQDQAWEAAKMISKLSGNIREQIGESLWALSSDLKDATNAQQHGLTKSMLRAFMVGYGFGESQYIDVVLGTIGPRLVQEPSREESILTTVGIMMGEAIAKPSLTLLNLAIEELAFLRYMGREDLLNTMDPSPHSPWRCIHIGGDDHLAIGPLNYLKGITEIHLRAGSHISEGQHGYSRSLVKYTERLINISNVKYGKPMHREYPKSIIVDSVKVRLMERGQSTLLQKDNKNIAIGKSAQMAGCLQWLPNDDNHWPMWHRKIIRDLFISRMGPFLPKKSENPRCYHAIHLPQEMGGYGLGFTDELLSHLEGSPDPFRWLISKSMAGDDIREDLRMFRRLNRNLSSRGIPQAEEMAELTVQSLRERAESGELATLSWDELKQKFPPRNENNRSTIAAAMEEGIYSFEDYGKLVARGNSFLGLLNRKEIKIFNTVPFVKSVNRLWTKCEEADLDIYAGADFFPQDGKSLIRLIRNAQPQLYFDINQETTSWEVKPGRSLDEFIEVHKVYCRIPWSHMKCHVSELFFDYTTRSYRADAEDRMPHMKLGFKFLKVKNPSQPWHKPHTGNNL
jgi:hypothetical protein